LSSLFDVIIEVSRSLAFGAVKRAALTQGKPIASAAKRGRPQLISQRVKELLFKAETEMSKHDIAPIRWLNRKLVCRMVYTVVVETIKKKVWFKNQIFSWL
jgi:hypothetical protein